MAFVFCNQFDEVTEQRVRDYYNTLSEKDGRRFAAFEAERLGRGGITYLADVLGALGAIH
ncbi:MAG: hypothetical protein KDA87_15950 [Planctomycetales bacterium]|nr:hypothetical protein [Planctomycetales bacterium]